MTERHLRVLGQEGDSLLRIVGDDPELPLQSRAGWDAGALLAHLGAVHRFWAEVVTSAARERPSAAYPEPAREDLAAWAASGMERLIAALEFTPPGRMVWTSTGPQPLTWVRRRAAVDMALHRWEAERVRGSARPIDADVAVDGIDEVLDHFLTPEGAPTASTSVHLHAHEGAGEWTVTLVPGGAEVVREHRRGNVAVRGSASDLLLLLWGRVGAEHVEVIGDAAALEVLRDRIDLSRAEA
jgi:uncharacterized protein (TIGR03083 family)